MSSSLGNSQSISGEDDELTARDRFALCAVEPGSGARGDRDLVRRCTLDATAALLCACCREEWQEMTGGSFG